MALVDAQRRALGPEPVVVPKIHISFVKPSPSPLALIEPRAVIDDPA
jgi:hypothetical protein